MSSQRYRKKNNSIVPALIASLLVISVLSIFFLSGLSDKDQKDKTESMQETEESISQKEFIDKISLHAQELQASYGVLPSIIIGQAILESNWGKSTLAREYNNLFGIKAYDNQKKVNLETKEYINEEWVVIQGDFRVYDSWEESMNDHTRLFVNGVTWNPRLYENVLLAKNYKVAAQALQEAGYATDPTYAEKVIHIIETYKLNQYDN